MTEPQDGYLDKAFESPDLPRRRARVYYGNHEGPSRDDPQALDLSVLAQKVEALMAAHDDLEERVQRLEEARWRSEGDKADAEPA